MKFCLSSCFAFMLCIFVCTTANAQSVQIEEDSSLLRPHYSYPGFYFLIGGPCVLLPNNARGTVAVSFPYTSTDEITGVTTNNIFQSPAKKVYHAVKPYENVFGIQAGGLRQVYNFNLAMGFYSNWFYETPLLISFGYGHSWYLNGLGEHETNPVNKRFVIRTTINFAYSGDYSVGGQSVLGTIDNTNKTIQAFGLTSSSQYTYTDPSGDGSDTASTKDLMISYTQKEWSLLPKISIGSNPFRNAKLEDGKMFGRVWNWALEIGYNIPFYDKGGILLAQDDGSTSDRSKIGSPVSLQNKDLTFLYNGKKTTTTPLHFSGLYLSFIIYLGNGRWSYR